MNVFCSLKSSFSHPIKVLRTTFALLLLLCLSACLFACQKEIRYFDYVSELRNNVFLVSDDEFSLRIYSVRKESPYSADGVPREMNVRTELWLVAPSGDQECNVSFTVDGETHGGKMSYDNVKAEYYLSCNLDISTLSTLTCSISYGETTRELTAKSVLSKETLSPETVLKNLVLSEQELFSSMTDKYGFAGEIYLRLIYEDSPYYYVGVIDRSGKTSAFLINATSGKILARREA